MDVADAYARMDPSVRAHVENVAANLQLTADLGYGDVTLLVPHEGGLLVVSRVYAIRNSFQKRSGRAGKAVVE